MKTTLYTVLCVAIRLGAVLMAVGLLERLPLFLWESPAGGFALTGLKLGSKQRLQQRLDKEKKRETSTVKKALLASAVAATITTGVAGWLVFIGPDGQARPRDATPSAEPQDAMPLAAAAVTSTDPIPGMPGGSEGESAYQAALKKLAANALAIVSPS